MSRRPQGVPAPSREGRATAPRRPRGVLPAARRALLGALVVSLTVLALGACAPPAAPAPPGDAPVVPTTNGSVRGSVDGEVRRFQGIPYAAPPVGELRWRAPQPALPWSGIRDGTQPGAPCPQSYQRGPDGRPIVVGSEDCLFLNVTTPRAVAGPRPVMVFLHGGGFVGGQGAPYDPARVVTRGQAVVVTVNYRLGALGFLDHPALDDPAAGNFGLADQQAALRWVRQNVAAFGGDPGNVTLWGESAGAFSTCAQLAAPGARGLFHKAIVQSGPCSNPDLTRPEAERRGLAAATALGCADPARAARCLRARPTDALAALDNVQVDRQVHRDLADVPWLPVAGTPALPLQPVDALRTGRAADVPLIHGGTRDEMRAQVAQAYDMLGHPLTAEQYPQVVTSLFGTAAGAVIAEYPLTDYSSPGVALATALTDEGRFVGACEQLAVLDAARSPVYAYEFTEPAADVVGTVPLGAHHGVDVPLFFDSAFPGAPPPSRTAEQNVLADRLIGYWTRFAATGSPGPDWPAYRQGTALSLGADRIGPVDIAREHRCRFWRSIPPPG